jgi:hypothetical protein
MIKTFINRTINYFKKKNIVINKNLFLLTSLKSKKVFLFYIILFFVFIFSTYLIIPKFFNFYEKRNIITKNILKNNGLEISNFSEIKYKIFPSPRIIIKDSEIKFDNHEFNSKKGSVIIILNLSDVLNIKKFNYNKIFIENSIFEVNLKRINFLDIVKNSKKKLKFKNVNFNFYDKKQYLFEVKNISSKIISNRSEDRIILNGLLANKKISINYLNNRSSKNNLTVKIPDFDIFLTSSFSSSSDENRKGFTKIEILSNHINLNFEKENDNSIKLLNSFIRSEIISGAFEGSILTEPFTNFLLYLNIKELDIEKIKSILKFNFNNTKNNNLQIYKKLNGIINFSSRKNIVTKNNFFSGKLIFQNGDILIKNALYKIGGQNYLIDGVLSRKEENFILDFIFSTDISQNKNFLEKIANKKMKKTFNYKVAGIFNFNTQKIFFQNIKLNENNFNKLKLKKIKEKFEILNTKENNNLIFDLNNINKFLLSVR